MTLPMLAPLRRRFPGARLSFLTSASAAPVLEGNPHVDEVVVFDAPWFYRRPWREYVEFAKGFRRRRFDLVIEARGDIRDILLLACLPKSRWRVAYGYGGGAWGLTDVVPFRQLKHKVDQHLDIARHLGAACHTPEWSLHLGAEETRAARETLAAAGVADGFIAFHPGSRMPLKRWPADRWIELGRRLAAETGRTIVLLGAPDEAGMVGDMAGGMTGVRVVDFSGRLGVRALAAAIKLADLLVCHDSAPMHLAACEGTPTVALFGPSVSVETGPFGDGHTVIERPMACRAACNEAVCRNARRQACMEDITVAEVVAAALAALRGATP